MSDFKFTNSSQPIPSAADLKGEFVVVANPSTDIWAKPPSTHRFNGPILHKTAPLSSFQRASVHIHGEWTTLYDQGGLILVMNGADGSQEWIKAGIEYVDGKAHISVVGKDQWADWSLMPLLTRGNEAGAGAKIEMVREKDVALWIYLVEGGERRRIRQVTWAFVDEGMKECWVGVYAAKPANEGGELAVAFKELEIELSE